MRKLFLVQMSCRYLLKLANFLAQSVTSRYSFNAKVWYMYYRRLESVNDLQ
jgi:hypothetical protein